MCDSNNGVLSKLVLSDTARSLDVICAGNDEKKRCFTLFPGEMKAEERVFHQNLSQKAGKFN